MNRPQTTVNVKKTMSVSHFSLILPLLYSQMSWILSSKPQKTSVRHRREKEMLSRNHTGTV